MYTRPTATPIPAATLADLLGPVETQYAECEGCSNLQIDQSFGEIQEMSVTAPDCAEDIRAFRLVFTPQNGQAGTLNTALVPVAAGSFSGDTWNGSPNVQIPFQGQVTITCTLVNLENQDIGVVCQTTTFVELDEPR